MASAPPPSYDECLSPRPLSPTLPPMDPEIRSALERHFSQKLWFKQKSLHKMTIHTTTPMPAYAYTLTGFMEERQVEMLSEPYRNQFIDRKQNGRKENKWDVPVSPPATYAFATTVLDIPHSSNVLSCPDCYGKGSQVCPRCSGIHHRSNRCPICLGEGKIETPEEGLQVKCRTCFSTGKIEETCDNCLGGKIQCPKCEGHKLLRYWESMEVNWKTATTNYYTDRGELGQKHLAKAKRWEIEQVEGRQGALEFEEDDEITRAAKLMVIKLLVKQNQDVKVLQYRQKICEIPVEKVTYTWKEEEGYFFIYGIDRRVYFPKRFQYRKMKCVIV